MFKFTNSAGAVLGVLLMITACTVALPFAGYNLTGPNVAAAPSPSTQNVRVVNPSTEPVPVSAQQNGVWNVGINGTPNVKLDGSGNTVKIDPAAPVPVRDVDNPAFQPFVAHQLGGFSNGGSSTGSIELTTVPVGKTFVIEYVSITGNMLPGQKMIDSRLITTHPDEPQQDLPLLMSFTGNNGFRDLFVTSQPIRWYASAGTTISAFVLRDSTAGVNAGSVNALVSGYYVDMP